MAVSHAVGEFEVGNDVEIEVACGVVNDSETVMSSNTSASMSTLHYERYKQRASSWCHIRVDVYMRKKNLCVREVKVCYM